MTDRIYLSPPDVGDAERTALVDAFDSGWVTSVGAAIDAFELEMAAFVGVRRAVAVSSGTAALHLALLTLGIGPRDRVVVPSFTFAASANAVRYVGAEPVFVDCDETWTVDPHLVADELGRSASEGRPIRAVMSVDLFGQACDYDALREVCERYGAILVEDAAEGLGATYRGRAAGSFGAVAALSFNGNKTMTTGGGGMLLTDDDAIADTARYLANQARDAVRHYEHRQVGFNYRMNNMLAALGRAQLDRLPDLVAARRAVNSRYAKALSDVPGVQLMPRAPYGEPTCWLTCIEVDPEVFGAAPEEICDQLDAQGIEARPTWKPMHLQPVYSAAAMVGGAVCERLYGRGVCLPSGSALTLEQQERVVAALLATPEKVRSGAAHPPEAGRVAVGATPATFPGSARP